MGNARLHAYGFFAFCYCGDVLDTGGTATVQVLLAGGLDHSFTTPIRRVSDEGLRSTVLGYVASSESFGNRSAETARWLQGPLCRAIVQQNRAITRAITGGAHVERMSQRPRKPRASMIVCLYGKPEYLFLQSALFAGGAGFEDYEMIYVSNSPELAEQLLKDLQTSALVYGLAQTLVLLPGNAGFGAANNVAVTHARSDRILIMNPDVFPRDADWARKHNAIVDERPKPETELFGAALYYDDGSLMHGGMYFDHDIGLTVDPTSLTAQRLIRVEHYGKGTPASSDRYTRSRPVPAVSGAFMSLRRDWFEILGGFSEDYVFGHYEDADLCLKSHAAGATPWLHELRLWHLEGKGSTRLAAHDGGAFVNRTLFSERWDALIADGLQGPNPDLRAAGAPAPVAEPTPALKGHRAAASGPGPRTIARKRSR